AKAAALVGGGKVSETIQNLTQGVLGMSGYHVKLLVVGVLLATGLGVGGGVGWLAPARAQAPAWSSSQRLTPEERVKQLEDQVQQAKKEGGRAKRERREGVHVTAKWRYEFVPAREVDAEQFVKVLQDRESGGWEFNGEASLKKDGKNTAVWVFRQPAGVRNYSNRFRDWPDADIEPR